MNNKIVELENCDKCLFKVYEEKSYLCSHPNSIQWNFCENNKIPLACPLRKEDYIVIYKLSGNFK